MSKFLETIENEFSQFAERCQNNKFENITDLKTLKHFLLETDDVIDKQLGILENNYKKNSTHLLFSVYAVTFLAILPFNLPLYASIPLVILGLIINYFLQKKLKDMYLLKLTDINFLLNNKQCPIELINHIINTKILPPILLDKLKTHKIVTYEIIHDCLV